jgi:hypothetical protein
MRPVLLTEHDGVVATLESSYSPFIVVFPSNLILYSKSKCYNWPLNVNEIMLLVWGRYRTPLSFIHTKQWQKLNSVSDARNETTAVKNSFIFYIIPDSVTQITSTLLVHHFHTVHCAPNCSRHQDRSFATSFRLTKCQHLRQSSLRIFMMTPQKT